MILAALMLPNFAVILNLNMVSIALPAIRQEFAVSNEVAAWVMTAYALPFALLMPTYGWLGDRLGKKRVYVGGIAVFLFGTLITLVTSNLSLFLVGRIIQGVGASGSFPLGMAMIADRFPFAERGKTLGTWNSINPAASMVAPLLAGVVIDSLGWQRIFWPVLCFGLLAALVCQRVLPGDTRSDRGNSLGGFDWKGASFLTLAVTCFMFYLTSQSVTDLPPFQDLRLLALACAFGTGFVLLERRKPEPFIDLGLFRRRVFTLASIGAGIRMFTIGSLGFLVPLYMRDVYQLNALQTGMIVTLHGIVLFSLMRKGGAWADVWGSRRLVTFGTTVEVTAITYLAFLPVSLSPLFVAAGVMWHGVGASLTQAALHRAAMNGIPEEESGVAAGLYSLIRYGGLMLGITLCGVVLQTGLDGGLTEERSYQFVWRMVASVTLLGVIVGALLREQKVVSENQ